MSGAFDHAPSGRAKCKMSGCGEAITKGAPRWSVEEDRGDEHTFTRHYHALCALKLPRCREAVAGGSADGWRRLDADEQQLILDGLEGAVVSAKQGIIAFEVAPDPPAQWYAHGGGEDGGVFGAACKACGEQIPSGETRVACYRIASSGKAGAKKCYHVSCYIEGMQSFTLASWGASLAAVKGWSALSESRKDEVAATPGAGPVGLVGGGGGGGAGAGGAGAGGGGAPTKRKAKRKARDEEDDDDSDVEIIPQPRARSKKARTAAPVPAPAPAPALKPKKPISRLVQQQPPSAAHTAAASSRKTSSPLKASAAAAAIEVESSGDSVVEEEEVRVLSAAAAAAVKKKGRGGGTAAKKKPIAAPAPVPAAASGASGGGRYSMRPRRVRAGEAPSDEEGAHEH